MGNLIPIKIVPQQTRYVVERLGRFDRVMEPGLNFMVPMIDKVKYRHSFKENDYQINTQEAVTKDNVHIMIDGVLYLKIDDAYKASYGSEDPIHFSDILAQSIMRAEIGKLTLDQTFEEKQSLNFKILEQITAASQDWGVKCVRYEIKDIHMQESFRDILNSQAESERIKRAEITQSLGERQSLINIAEGEKERMILESEGRAEKLYLKFAALAERIGLIADSIDDHDVDRNGLKLTLSESAFDTIENLADERNNIILSKDMTDPEKMLQKMVNKFE